MPRTPARYPPEFHRQPVELIRAGTPLEQVAEELGVPDPSRRGATGAARATSQHGARAFRAANASPATIEVNGAS
jgi:hypothetical protein